MGATKLLSVFVAVAVLMVFFELSLAAPKPNPIAPMDRQDLAQRFAEFLHEDKEMAGALEAMSLDEDHLVRNKRQSGTSTTQGGFEDFGQGGPKEPPGFFDRAAKFVTELLQRFLKWINSNDN